MQLYLVRHGRTEWNERGLMQGRQDSPLTLEGIGAARQLGQALRHIDFGAAYTSPSGRAKRTAELILEGRDIHLTEDDRLLERGLGSMEGQPLSEARARFTAASGFLDIPDAESLDSMRTRIVSLLEDLRQHEGEAALLVSHAVTCRMVTAHLRADGSDEAFLAQAWLANAQALHFIWDGRAWREEPFS